MTCATTISVSVPGNSTNLIVRSTCNYKGQPWFDWIVMEWPEHEILEDSEISSNKRMCFAKVHGFVRYDNNDYTTFRKKHKLEGFQDIEQTQNTETQSSVSSLQRDSNLYIVLETGTKFEDTKSLGKDMIRRFKIRDSDKGLRIFPIECSILL